MGEDESFSSFNLEALPGIGALGLNSFRLFIRALLLLLFLLLKNLAELGLLIFRGYGYCGTRMFFLREDFLIFDDWGAKNGGGGGGEGFLV